jgi:class 3 adenylate cyclase
MGCCRRLKHCSAAPEHRVDDWQVAVSGSDPAGRLDRAVAAFLRQEFGSPVAAIIGFIDILIEDARRDGLDAFIPDLDRMRAAAAQLFDLIGRMADSSAVDASDGARAGNLDSSRIRHELRTPLTAIKGYGEMLVEEAREGSHGGFAQDLGGVLDLAGRLLADIDRVVAFGEGTSDPAIAPSIEVVRDVLRTIAPLGVAEAPRRRTFSSRILVVDDNAANRDVLSRRLLRDGHQVATAEDGAAALALLLNILPRTIIERLRQGETVIADRIADATILFSDLVDFTALAAKMSPERMVELLGSLFSRFDAIAEQLGLEKIKTIGDGYMVAGGLPQPRPDHAMAVAEMALAMHAAADGTAAMYNQPIRLRIGIHTGALVAGVIGTHKFVYDVWGIP